MSDLIQRYDVATAHKAGQQPRGVMIENAEGAYVLHDALAAAEARIAELEAALGPFCFFLDDAPTTQDAWETVYRDRFEDWVDYNEIEAARTAMAKRTA